MNRSVFTFCPAAILVIVCFFFNQTFAQGNLDRHISINVKRIKIADLLNNISKKGDFYFSYSSDMIKTDSLVTLSADNQSIRTVLDEVFHDNVDYKEALGYIILRPAPNRLMLIPDTTAEPENAFYISGYVVDDNTGAKIGSASVYEKKLLVSTLTDANGFFKLKIKTNGPVTLTVSKELYKDTSVNFLSKVTVTVKPRKYYYSADATSVRAEKSWLGRAFISSRQKIQSLNLGGYVSNVPVQTSLTPGLSSHGIMSGQIINHFSINILGGYTAGVDGAEIGGLFNINKQEVKYMQAAGLFNMVGGNLKGVQLAGLSNTVLKSVKGLQAAGLYNQAKDSLTGIQLAGLFNKVEGNSRAVQAAGLVNNAQGDYKGLKIAGIANITGKESSGLQIAGVYNRAKIIKGVAFSMVNIADTLKGCAIGLVNISRNGYHNLLVYSSETTMANIAFKSGNASLYSILSGGMNFTNQVKFYSYGFGIGHDFIFNRMLSLSTEASVNFLQSGEWKNRHQINRFNTLFNIKTSSKFAFFFGPSFNVYNNSGSMLARNEEKQITHNKPGLMDWGNGNMGWIGWSAGVMLF